MQASKRAFTLVELLVVITILAIISVVAYTSFGGATDKAKNSTKLNHIATIESALNLFNQQKNYYPLPSASSASNFWGYSGAVAASTGNTVVATLVGEEISAITGGGGGYVTQSGGSDFIGAKGVIDSSVLTKELLSVDLLDPALKDIKVGSDKTYASYGIGKYIYGVYSRSATTLPAWNSDGKKGVAYNLAITITDDSKNEFAKITGNFDSQFSGCLGKCPDSLIGPGGSVKNLKDGDVGGPYKVSPAYTSSN